ncbi:MAG: helix-turn-helix domain-containing protein [Betaproteobacteria bacterium]|nr:helix-turn-helix domain-containing protein [Betaproteobacteria bacterium]
MVVTEPNQPPSASGPAAGVTAYGSLLGHAGGEQLALVCCPGKQPAFAVVLYRSPPYEFHVPALQVPRLSINLTASSVFGGVEAERRRTYEARRHSIFLTPPSAAVQWRKRSPSRHLAIYFRRQSLDDESDCADHLQHCGPIFNVTLPECTWLIEQLEAEMTAPGPFATEVVDSLAHLLLIGFACRRSRSTGPLQLSTALLRQLEEYVDANLARRILVADLAAVVGLPAQSFAKAYLRYTGRSPHQFVLAQRVERATDMLRHSPLSLTEVAAACGFSSQQHMTHVLSDRLGVAPSAVRGDALQESAASRNR